MTETNEKFSRLADQAAIDRVIKALEEKGISVDLAENNDEAVKKIFGLIPEGAEVMTMTSTSLVQLGADKIINESGKFQSARQTFKTLDEENRKMEIKRLGSAPSWAIGSVHALLEDGSLLIASATGSQLPAYAYGADNVLWVIGAQKIVKDLDEGMKRIYDYVFPLENERSLKAYGMGSGVNKVLLINKETVPGRLNVLIVKQKLGF